MSSMLPAVAHVGAVTAAVVGLGGSAALVVRSGAVRGHRRGAMAVVAATVGLAGLLAAAWSPRLRDALGAFVTSPGLGGLAAAAAATLALYGVLRELGAAADRSSRQRHVQAAEEHARHFRWACELVLSSGRPADVPVVQFVLDDLHRRAPTEIDQRAARALVGQHIARVAAARQSGSTRRGRRRR